MLGTKNPRVKICCISSRDEALMAIKFGASALGLVSNMPSGPGVISEKEILEIVKIIPPAISSFLLTCETKAEQIILQQRKLKTNTIQIVDEIETGEYEELKIELAGISIVQVIHILDEKSIEQAVTASEYVDALLLDSGNPNLKIKELGGTGRVHNWEISRQIREVVNIPIFLAGGLNAENVRQAIETVQPFGVDLCSGVRTNGKLDERKLENFFYEVNKNNS